MAKVFDLTKSDGLMVVLGRALVVPASESDSIPPPNGAIRFNPTMGKVQFYFNDAWNTLGDDQTNTGVSNIANDHTHSISHILGLQQALGNKAPLVHIHAISEISGLAEELTNRALLVHTHGISNISGLQAALDGKSNITHTHTLAAKEKISACLPGNPPANLSLVWTAAETVILPAGLPNSKFHTTIAPASNYTIALLHNSSNVGNITLTPVGDVIVTFTNSITLNAGDILTFSLPVRDSALNTLSFTILANVPNQIIA